VGLGKHLGEEELDEPAVVAPPGVAVAPCPALVGVELLVEAVLQLEGVGWAISGTPTEMATMPATRSGWSAAKRSDRQTPSWHSPTSTTGSEPVASSTAASSARYASSV
jgi:hypothetical protein